MNSVTSHKSVVYPWHCDFNDHMNVQFYVQKFDEATWYFFNYLGYNKTFLHSNNATFVAVEQNTQYFRELVAGDVVSIQSKLISKRGKVIKFKHQMFNTETEVKVAETELTAVTIDKTTRKSIKLDLEKLR